MPSLAKEFEDQVEIAAGGAIQHELPAGFMSGPHEISVERANRVGDCFAAGRVIEAIAMGQARDAAGDSTDGPRAWLAATSAADNAPS